MNGSKISAHTFTGVIFLMNRLFVGLILAAVAVVFATIPAFGLDIFFEHTQREELSRGVTYERTRMMTSRGMLDVHTLFVDLDEPYVTIGPVASNREIGLRETTSRLISDANAIAGVNADFFTMARLHSMYYGAMVRDGEVVSLNAHTYPVSTFFLDTYNNPFFMYMRTTLRLYANGVRRSNVVGYNSVGGMLTGPTVISRTAMETTAQIDARIENVSKVVVENGIVTRVSLPGETVAVPENGFVVLFPYYAFPYHAEFYRTGTSVEFNVVTDVNVDFASIQAAIGGGAAIMRNGQILPPAGVQPNHRHPRTAVGATADGRIVLMTVDGRTHSVGVTHAELGSILQRRGVVNAMHMDGGGSTTMVARRAGGTHSVVNTLSDGSQRRVTNALGVFDNSPVGQKIGIVLEPSQTRAIQGVPISADVFGVDSWGNRIPLGYIFEIIPAEIIEEEEEEPEPEELPPVADFVIREPAPVPTPRPTPQPTIITHPSPYSPVFLSVPADGFWADSIYTPLRTGRHELRVTYGQFSTTSYIEVYALGELQSRRPIVSLLEGGRERLEFSGIATDGTQVNVPGVTLLTVTPNYLGYFENGYFVAQRGGTGYITAIVGAVRAYIPVTIGGFPWPVNMFATPPGFISQPPEYVFTRVSTADPVIRMDYNFSNTIQTQAANVTFYPPLEIPGEPIAMRLLVYGNESGHWLRARVRDADGTHHNIDFAREIDFAGWRHLTANLPNAPTPFTLDRIYAVSLESLEPTQNTLFFRNLEALYAPNHNLPVPRGTVFADNLRVARDFAGLPGGFTHVLPVPRAEDETVFSVAPHTNLAVATMTARAGGIQATNIEQWRNFLPMLRGHHTLHNVVILLDENPKDFTRRMEYELFHTALTMLRDEGRTVFVVSATGEETTMTMRDNIRYINLAQNEYAPAIIRFFTDPMGEIRWTD